MGESGQLPFLSSKYGRISVIEMKVLTIPLMRCRSGKFTINSHDWSFYLKVRRFLGCISLFRTYSENLQGGENQATNAPQPEYWRSTFMSSAAQHNRGIDPGNYPASRNLASPAAKPVSSEPSNATSYLQEAIRRRAEEIYERSGQIEGRDVKNWIQAEAEIRSEMQSAAPGNAAIVVKVDGVKYVGEYNESAADGYAPGEFVIGDPVPVRLQGDWMFVMRRNGKELQTRVIERMS
jgi:hypothetical protein